MWSHQSLQFFFSRYFSFVTPYWLKTRHEWVHASISETIIRLPFCVTWCVAVSSFPHAGAWPQLPECQLPSHGPALKLVGTSSKPFCALLPTKGRPLVQWIHSALSKNFKPGFPLKVTDLPWMNSETLPKKKKKNYWTTLLYTHWKFEYWVYEVIKCSSSRRFWGIYCIFFKVIIDHKGLPFREPIM